MTGYADLPSTEIAYSNTPGDTTFVRWEAQKAPRELISLASKLESIQQTTDWTSANLK